MSAGNEPASRQPTGPVEVLAITASGSMQSESEGRLFIPQHLTFADIQRIPVKYFLGLIGLVFTVFSFGMAANHWFFSEQSKALPTPDPKRFTEDSGPRSPPRVNPAPAPINQRENLRTRDHVVLIDPVQNDLPLERIPEGRYGYASHGRLESYIQYQAKFPLLISYEESTYRFEIHKIDSNTIKVIGFVSKQDALTFGDPTRKRQDFQIFSDSYIESTVPISVNFQEIESWTSHDLPGSSPSVAEIHLRLSDYKH